MGNSTFKNIIITTLANLSTILSGVLLGFLIPKIMGINEYGYYKTFTLYMTYVGLFHFGFSDGIYLKYTGTNYESLDKEKFRTFFRVLMFSQFITILFLLCVSLLFYKTEYFFILLFVVFNCLVSNIIFYFQFVSQMTSKFKIFSILTSLKSILTIILVIVLFILYKCNTLNYLSSLIFIAAVTLIDVFIAFIYIILYKDLIFGKSTKFTLIKSEVKYLYKNGFILMIANFFVSLILIIDRQFVQVLFPNETYAIYAFAYNMLGLITTAISSISAVLFAALRKYDCNELKKKFNTITCSILCFVALSFSLYFPLCLIVENFLFNYYESLKYFQIIFPSLILTTQISIVLFNYYKISNEIKKYFKHVFIVFIVSFCLNLFAYLIFKTPVAISIVSILSVLIWYILSLPYIVKKFEVKCIKDLIFALLSMIVFYTISIFINNYIIGFIIYLVLCVLFILLFYYIELKNIVKNLRQNRYTK